MFVWEKKNVHEQAQTQRLSHAGELFTWDHAPGCEEARRICPSLESLLKKCTLLCWLVKTFEKSKCLSQPSLCCQFLAKCVTPVYILQLHPSTEILPSKWAFQGKTEKALLWDKEIKSFSCEYKRIYFIKEGQILLGCLSSHVSVNLFTFIHVYV